MKSKKHRVVIPTVAGVLFISIGLLIALFHLMGDLRRAAAFANADEVPMVELLDLRRERISGKRDRYHFEYSYEVEGELYMSRNAVVHRDQSLNGHLEKVIYRDLAEHRDYVQLKPDEVEEMGLPTCWVLPNDPSDAVLNPDLSRRTLLVQVLSVLAFLVVGGFSIYAAVWESRKGAK